MRAELQPWDAYLEEISPRYTVAGNVAAFWTLGVNLLVPLAVVVGLLVVAHRLRRRAAVARALEEGGDTPPTEGQELIRGIVEAKGVPAVRLSIHQAGTESSHKNTWTTQWNEIHREIEVRPFVLVTQTGARVRCEPDRRTKLIDKLDRTERVSLVERICRAVLSNGERATVQGRLTSELMPRAGDGYRGSPTKELVLKPGPKGMVISTLGLDTPLSEAAAVRQRWAKRIFLAIVVAQLAAVRWHASAFLGHVEPAIVTLTTSRSVRKKQGYSTIHTVHYQLDDSNDRNEDDVASNDMLQMREGRTIPVRVSPIGAAVGARPSESVWFLLFPSLLLVGMVAAARIVIETSKPWYERRKVNESRTGRLDYDLPKALKAKKK